VNQIDQKPVAAFRIDGGGADGPRGLRHIFRPRQAEAGWLSSRCAGTHPAADVAPVLSGCLTVSEPKVRRTDRGYLSAGRCGLLLERRAWLDPRSADGRPATRLLCRPV